MLTDEIQLLREYAATRSQPAFAQLAQRYVDLVYSAARRQCRGDSHLAEDVTQAVFIILAEKAGSVPADRPLSAWLLKTTAYCAANARRSKTHRDHYERRAAQMARMNELTEADESAWDDLAPMLDEGMNRLRPQDRDALLLKFFEKKSMRQIGDALGISEEAAGKRVARAVDRLRDFFRRRGVAVSAAALPVLLATNAAPAAPAAVVSAVVAGAGAATVAAAAATAATGTSAATTATTTSAASVAKGALAVMAVEKAKAVALAAAAIVLGVGASAVVVKTVIAPVSRGNRQVAVAAQPAVARDAADTRPANLDDGWPIRFADGTVVEVLGLCEPNADIVEARDAWWALDGSKIAPPTGRPDAGAVTLPAIPGTRMIQLLLRFPSLAADTSRTVSLRPSVGGTATHTSAFADGRGGGGITQHCANVRTDQATADLLIGLSSGPWETLATYDVKTLQSSQPASSPVLRKVVEEGGALVVHATVPGGPAAAAGVESGQRLTQLVAITSGGEVRASSVRFSNSAAEARFPVKLADVRGFEWRARPVVYVQAQNVSLRRAVPTTVRVSEVASPTSTSAAAAAR